MKEGEGMFVVESERKNYLIAGGSGFIGSRLADKLTSLGHTVMQISRNGGTDITNADSLPEGKFDHIIHLASYVSPRDFLGHPEETLLANSVGTINLLNLAEELGARFLYASSARVYRGEDPSEPRAVYEQAKRYGEAITALRHRQCKVNTQIARIYQTFGPGCRLDDGHVIPTFIRKALANEPIELLGGNQQAYFIYINDTVSGLIHLLNSNESSPVDIGPYSPISIWTLALMIIERCESKSKVIYRDWPVANERRPNLMRLGLLGWSPMAHFHEGLDYTIDYFKEKLK